MSSKFNDLQLKEENKKDNQDFTTFNYALKNININLNLESYESEDGLTLLFTPEIEFEVLVGGRNENK